MKTAIGSEDSSLCEKMTNNEPTDYTSKDNCYKEIATSKNNLSLCEKIEYLDLASACYADIAVNLNDPSICGSAVFTIEDFVINSSDTCYSRVATTIKDPSLCEKINGIRIQEQCYTYSKR